MVPSLGGIPCAALSASLALCALTPALTAAQPAAASWSVQPSPNVPHYSDYLAHVAATSGSNAWAVGEYFSTGTGRTLVEHWDGQRWSVQPSPSAGSAAGLAGVAATSASSAWAVGFSATGSTGTNRTLIEHWDGQRWAVQPSPNVGIGRNDLTGVAATSASNAWAVGYVFRGSGIQTLIEHWDGQRWAVQPSPDLGTSNQLWGVAATSAASAWAVGSYGNGTGPDQTLIEHWDGQSWAVQSSPTVGTQANVLYGVAATSASSAWAVGSHPAGRTLQTLVLNYH